MTRRQELAFRMLAWLDDHPVTARLYVPVVATVTLLVGLFGGQ